MTVHLSLSWLGTGTSIKSDGKAKLVLGAQIALLVK
jgi:hypothetical protein